MSWLADGSPETVAEAVARVAPWLAGARLELSNRPTQSDPRWASSSALLANRYIAKFAWSQPAAFRLAREISVLRALDGSRAARWRPRLVAGNTDPLLLITERVSGQAGFTAPGSLPPNQIAQQSAAFLAVLHSRDVRKRLAVVVGGTPPSELSAETAQLRDRLPRVVRPDQRRRILAWCDWVDDTLTAPRRTAIVHGDFHGDNQVWSGGRLRLVVDYETVGLAEPEYDFRAIAPAGPAVTPLLQTMRHYQQLSGSVLSLPRVVAWHIRTVLGDVLRRSETGVALADGRTAQQWLDDLAVRLRLLQIDPFRLSSR